MLLVKKNGEDSVINFLTIDVPIKNPEVKPIFDDLIKSTPDSPFIIYIRSPGGGISIGRAMADMLTSYDVPVTIISNSLNSSMGAIFPHLGNFIRLCYTSSTFLYHHAKYDLGGTYDEVNNALTVLSDSSAEMDKAVMKASGLNVRQYKKYNGTDYRITAEQALSAGTKGLIDGIIIKDFRDGKYLIKTREGNKVIDATKHRRSDLSSIPVV